MDPLATVALVGGEWATSIQDSETVVVLSGDWIVRRTGVDPGAAERLLAAKRTGTLSFDTTQLGHWDSALIVFLWDLRARAKKCDMVFDQSGLPQPTRQLLALAPIDVGSTTVAVPIAHRSLPEWVGRRVIAGGLELVQVFAMVGQTILRSVPALRGRAGLRRGDVLDCAWEAGVAALPIVTVVNVLVGGILAFVGAVQLRRFGASIYVANLVGVAVVREMAALMTAIVMSGRTGGAYAAHIATMNGNEEIDALRVVGIPVYDYLILPRVVALTGMLPILYLYGCAVGIFGGFLVAVVMFNLGAETFIEQTRSAINGTQFLFGLTKSIVFGAVVAFAGCRVGLRAGRSAADVGRAATMAVVIGIVSVIAIDALFAACANALGI